jgi:hypothetical protein
MRIIQHMIVGSRALENGEKPLPPSDARLKEISILSTVALCRAHPGARFEFEIAVPTLLAR